MTFFLGDADFTFGGGELLLTAVAAGIIFGLLGPKWLRQQREKREATTGGSAQA